mgnify:CR=1 FL=1
MSPVRSSKLSYYYNKIKGEALLKILFLMERSRLSRLSL